MCEAKKIVEELRNKKSRDNRDLLDRSADMIEKLAKELCEKSGCHHKCHDTKDCVVEDEAELLISNKLRCIDCIHNEICQFYNALGTKVICYPCGFYEAKEVIANSATTTEKQIEEMAKVIIKVDDTCRMRTIAERLYNAGYRKQSEGEWIDKPTGAYRRMQSWCSACGKHSGIGGIESNRHKPFCPNCGAKMKGGAE